MKWLAVHIDASPSGLEPVEAALSALGIDGLVIEDETDFRRFLEQNKQYWDYVDEELDRSMTGKCRVTFYVEDTEAGFGQVAAARIAMAGLKEKHPEYAPLLMTMEGVEDADWENNWKAFYKPMEIGERLMVIPDWEEADPKGRAALRLNPGLAFGTGGHATTRLCMELLEESVTPGCAMLDVGCGSGILAVCSVLLGAKSAVGVDIDELAAKIAGENAALNDVSDQTRFIQGDLTEKISGQFDVVCANIVADVIIRLCPSIPAFLKPDGVFLASGIIDERSVEVEKAIQKSGLVVTDRREEGGWVALRCRLGE